MNAVVKHLSVLQSVYYKIRSKSLSKVPLITFCKPTYALMRNKSLRNPIKGFVSSTPSSIDNTTFAIYHIFKLCVYVKKLRTTYENW